MKFSVTYPAAGFMAVQGCHQESYAACAHARPGGSEPQLTRLRPQGGHRRGLHPLALRGQGCAAKLPDVSEGKSERCSTSQKGFVNLSFSEDLSGTLTLLQARC